MRPRLRDQKQRDIFNIRGITPSKRLQRLGEVVCCRSVVAAEGEQEPAEHREIFLLEKRDVLARVIHQNVDDAAGAYADSACQGRRRKVSDAKDKCIVE